MRCCGQLKMGCVFEIRGVFRVKEHDLDNQRGHVDMDDNIHAVPPL